MENITPKKPFYKSILSINIFILLIYYIVCMVWATVAGRQGGEFAGAGPLLVYIGIYLVHTTILFITSLACFFRKDSKKGREYLLSAILIPLIALGGCTGWLSLSGM